MNRLILPASILVLSFITGLFASGGIGIAAKNTGMALDILKMLGDAGLLLSGAWLGKRTIELFIKHLWHREGRAPKFVSDIVGVVLFAGAILCIVAFVLHKPVTGVLATSGLVVAILGFALQSTFSNIFSGMALNIASPFRMGDWLTLETGETGKVIEFNWRETRLETIEGRMIVIPNGMMADKKFLNLNVPAPYYRIKLPIYVDYSAPSERVCTILQSAIKATDRLVTERPSVVLLESFDERGVKYTLNYWVPNYPDSFSITNQLMTNAINYLNQAGLAPAYPKRDVTMSQAPWGNIKRQLDPESLLQRVELFQSLDETSLGQLEKAVHITTVDTDTLVVREGDEGDSLFVVVTGLLEVLKIDNNGNNRRMAKLSPGEIFGEMSLLTGERRTATVRALTPVTLIEVRKSHLRPILALNPDLVANLSEIQDRRQQANRSAPINAHELSQTTNLEKASLLQKIRSFFQLD